MIEFPIAELMDESLCGRWLERHLHPQGLTCPHYGDAARRLFRAQGDFPAYRGRACDGYYTLLSGTVFAKTQQRPATHVLLRRGIAKGEPTARLARALGLSRQQLHTLRQRIQTNLHETVPTGMMTGTTFEADELYQNAGGKKAHPIRTPRIRPGDAPTSGKGTAPTALILPRSSVSYRGTQVSTVSGFAITPANGPVTH
jgi:hypothetical protein